MKLSYLVLAVGFAAVSASAAPHDVEGRCLTEMGDGHVEIRDCGDAAPCGVLVWFDPASAYTDRDARNKDVLLRDRPLLGVPIVWGFERGPKSWRSGRIYNPVDGKIFSSSLALKEDGTLRVKGCLGPICRTNVWTRISAANEGSE